jgi:transcriptional regulator with XRE-family HTH domain
MLAVNPEAIQRLRHKIGPDITVATNDELAARIGVSPATMSRVLAGKSEPGKKFMECVIKNLGYNWFAELIEVVE